MFGEMQEEQSLKIQRQEDEIAQLKKEKNIWQEDFKKLNEKNLQSLTVQEIEVKIVNANKFKLDPLSVFELEEDVKENINMVLAKDLNLVFNSRELLKRAIENMPVRINDKRYQLTIKEMVIYTTLTLQLEIQFAK